MIKSFSFLIPEVKYVIGFLMFALLLSNKLHSQDWDYVVSNKNNSVIDTFYFEIGYTKKGKFFESDVALRTKNGFWKNGISKPFSLDTLYTPISKGSTIFQKMMDGAKLEYHMIDNLVLFFDSLSKSSKNPNLLYIPLCPTKKNKSICLVFMGVVASIQYNDSYILERGVDESYSFDQSNRLIRNPMKSIIYKPILRMQIINTL